jgi:hypothetical protein
MITPPLPEYIPGKFVNRESEIALIEGMVRKLAEGGRQPGQPHVITIRGQRGTGKSWLSLHLKRTILSEIPSVKPLLIGLVSTINIEYRPQGIEKQTDEKFYALDQDAVEANSFVVETLMWIADNLGTTRMATADASELSNWMVRDIRQKLSHKVIVLILDSVFEAEWKYLKQLEEYVLVPLATLTNTLLVMTGRGSSYPWISPHLRMAEERSLGALKDIDTKKQLRLQVPEADLSNNEFKEIVEISAGNPMVNVLIASSPNKKETLDQTANLLLDIKTAKRNNPEIRDYFEALSILDGFGEEEIGPLLDSLHNNPKSETWSDEDKRRVKDEMLSTHLVRWESGKYVIDESVRRILESYLRMDKASGKWERLHRRATQLYEEWARKYTKHSKFFMNKANEHSKALKSEGLS